MQYTERTTRSYGDRVKSSFGGGWLGLLLFVAGTVLLWWNEGNFVKTRAALTEAQSITVEVPDITQPDPALNGQLIHAMGQVTTPEILRDPLFGIQTNAVALRRTVEYYQWVESSRSERHQKLGGGEETVTTYSYQAAWVHSPVDSNGFHAPEARMQYVNTVLYPGAQDETIYARNVLFGAYQLPDFLIHAIPGSQPLNVVLDPMARDHLNRELAARVPASPLQRGNHVEGSPFSGMSVSVPDMLHEQGDTLYLGSTPAMPAIGDVRIRFTQTPATFVSLIARVSGNTFEPYTASNGRTVSALVAGSRSLEEMFAGEQSSNETMTWVFRGLGVVLCIAGLNMVLGPLSVLVSLLPFLGSIVSAGTGLVSSVVGFAWSVCVMALAWIVARPHITIAVFVLAFLMIGSLYAKGRKSRKAA